MLYLYNIFMSTITIKNPPKSFIKEHWTEIEYKNLVLFLDKERSKRLEEKYQMLSSKAIKNMKKDYTPEEIKGINQWLLQIKTGNAFSKEQARDFIDNTIFSKKFNPCKPESTNTINENSMKYYD